MIIFRCPNCLDHFEDIDGNVCPKCGYASDETLHAMSVRKNIDGLWSYEWRTEFLHEWEK